MILLEDTRQQEKKHSKKHKYFLENGIHWNRSTLICGDYQIAGNGSVAVDTKFSIQELIGDIQFKAISKKDIETQIRDIYVKNHLCSGRPSEIFHLITDDDYDRFAEREISEYCFKHNIPESVLNEFQTLYIKRHGFFHRGLVRAKYYDVKLHILVDNEDGVEDISSLLKWVNPRRKIFVNSNEQIGWYKNGKPRYRKVPKYPNCMMGEQLAKACLTMQLRYGCEFHFCKPSEAGVEVVRLLMENKGQEVI